MESSSSDRNLIVLLGAFTLMATLIISCTIFIAIIKICNKRKEDSKPDNSNEEMELKPVVRRKKELKDVVDLCSGEPSDNGFDEQFRRRSLEWQQKRQQHDRDSIFFRNEKLLASNRQIVLGNLN